MPSYTVEFKKKTPGGFTHSRQVVDSTDEFVRIFNEAGAASFDGLEFLTIRQVKPKPEPKPKEIKK